MTAHPSCHQSKQFPPIFSPTSLTAQTEPLQLSRNIEQQGFNNFIKYARIYFKPEATEEILDELRPLMCPFDMSMTKAFERYHLFLPTLVHEHEAERSYRFGPSSRLLAEGTNFIHFFLTEGFGLWSL